MKDFWKKCLIFGKDKAKMDYPDPKLKSPQVRAPLGMKKNKKGQMFMVSILFIIMAFLIFIATLPATKEMINNARSCQYLNCAGYIDTQTTSGATCSATNKTYHSDLEEDSLACTILDLALPFLILGVLAGLIYKITMGRSEAQPQLGGY